MESKGLFKFPSTPHPGGANGDSAPTQPLMMTLEDAYAELDPQLVLKEIFLAPQNELRLLSIYIMIDIFTLSDIVNFHYILNFYSTPYCQFTLHIFEMITLSQYCSVYLVIGYK